MPDRTSHSCPKPYAGNSCRDESFKYRSKYLRGSGRTTAELVTRGEMLPEVILAMEFFTKLPRQSLYSCSRQVAFWNTTEYPSGSSKVQPERSQYGLYATTGA